MTIFDPVTRRTLESRIGGLSADSRRKWGKMSAHQAVCHLSDAFRMSLGDTRVAPRPGAPKWLIRIVALHLPLRWPAGVKTLPQADQAIGGTRPVEFERDRLELLALIERFCGGSHAWPEHPMFGSLSTREWGVWAYRHLDHHLRQFGC